MIRRAGLLAVVAAFLLFAVSAEAAGLTPAVHHASAAVNGARTFDLPRASTHVAVYWRGSSSAHVTVQFSRDGRRFGSPRAVQVDDAGEGVRPGVTYGTVMVARGVTAQEEARQETISAVIAALRANVSPTEVARLSPFTATYVRRLAREHGVPPALPGPKRPAGK